MQTQSKALSVQKKNITQANSSYYPKPPYFNRPKAASFNGLMQVMIMDKEGNIVCRTGKFTDSQSNQG